jgi:hypothetical protein
MEAESGGPAGSGSLRNEERDIDDLFWPSPGRRAKFLGLILIEIMIDGAYLTGVYFWSRFIEHLAGEFEDVGGYELVMLIITKFVLTVLPAIVTLWYVILDFIGTMWRIWKRRNG